MSAMGNATGQAAGTNGAATKAGGCCGGASASAASAGADAAACCERGPETAEEIMALSPEQLIARYRRGVENFEKRVFWLAGEQVDRAFLPEAGVGRWSVRVLLGHLADAEIASTHRVRRAVAEDGPVFALWDENAFIDSGVYGVSANAGGQGQGTATPPHNALSVGGFVAVVHTLRQFMTEFLRTLTPEQWERRSMHPERGEQTVRRLVAGNVWHLEHHARFLKQKVDLMLGPPEATPAVPAGGGAVSGGGGGCGCGPGCCGGKSKG